VYLQRHIVTRLPRHCFVTIEHVSERPHLHQLGDREQPTIRSGACAIKAKDIAVPNRPECAALILECTGQLLVLPLERCEVSV
jgi:hypothetical protein